MLLMVSQINYGTLTSFFIQRPCLFYVQDIKFSMMQYICTASRTEWFVNTPLSILISIGCFVTQENVFIYFLFHMNKLHKHRTIVHCDLCLVYINCMCFERAQHVYYLNRQNSHILAFCYIFSEMRLNANEDWVILSKPDLIITLV